MQPLPLPAVAAAVAALLATGCGPTRASSPEQEAAVAVRTAPVEHGPVLRPIRAAGTVAAKDRWDLSFQVGGLLARVSVREGDAIRKGQVLATLDPTEVAAGVRQAREGLAKARRERERARTLGAAEVIPRSVAEDAETAVAVAEAAADSAEFALRHATLVAPDDGWVDRRLAEPGEVVAPGRPILHVSGRGRGFVVRSSLPDRDVLDLVPGQAATVTLDALPGTTFRARVAEISRTPAPGTGTYAVEVRLDPSQAPRELVNGLTAKVEIERTVLAEGVVPLSALLDGDGSRGAVFVPDGGRARRVPVRVAFLKAGVAVVAEGLEGVDRVITDGVDRVSDGTRLRLVP